MSHTRQDALVYLGLQLEDWGPAYMDLSEGGYDYATFAAYWRGSVPCPSEQAILDAIAALDAADIPPGP